MKSHFPLAAVLALAACAVPLRAAFQTGEAADVVLGQPGFTTKAQNISATGTSYPEDVAIDPTTGKVFVSGYGLNGVYRYTSTAAMASGAAAEAVLGQPAFGTNSSTTSQSGMNNPHGITVDSNGRLWVADSANNRVLRFDNASSKATGANADGVLGQSTYAGNTTATLANRMSYPSDVSVDSQGNLWVADYSNSRVLRFNLADLTTNGASAKVVLGETNFTTSTGGLSQNLISGAGGVYAAPSGAVYISDNIYARVLRFDGAATFPDNTMGPNASAVIGQPNFTTGTMHSDATGMSGVLGIEVNAAGTLYACDYPNHRVIAFPGADTLSSGGTATIAIGQADLTAHALLDPPSAQSLNTPSGLTLTSDGKLWIADTQDQRALRYSQIPVVPQPEVVLQGPKKITTTRAKVILKGTASDAGGTLARVEAKIGQRGYRPAIGTSSWRYVAKVKPGRNRVSIRAVDVSGITSNTVEAVIRRVRL